jgi:hypothetical protein
MTSLAILLKQFGFELEVYECVTKAVELAADYFIPRFNFAVQLDKMIGIERHKVIEAYQSCFKVNPEC